MKTAEEILKLEGMDFDDRGRNETDPIYLFNLKRAMYAYASEAIDLAAKEAERRAGEFISLELSHSILEIKSELK